MAIASINPATGETVRTFESFSTKEVEDALVAARAAFISWRKTRMEERAALLGAAAEVLDRDRESLARLATLEMGKPLTAALAEVAKSASVCRFYAERGAEFLADEEVETSASRSFIRYEPLGVVLAVMPWNFPFWQVFRFAAPALMAGNAALLKHASNVPQCAVAIQTVFQRAGFPEHLFQTLLVESDAVAGLVGDPRIAAATLTGSEQAGSSVAAAAGRAIKKTVLELGGSDPFIITPSADLDEAARVGVKARMVNNGQSCIAAKRFIVFEEVAGDFSGRFRSELEALQIGDPFDEKTDVGPLANEQILRELEVQISDAVSLGAKIVMGGKRIDGKGNFFAPTILTGIPRGAKAYREELFGPVAAMYVVRNMDEAIDLANDTPFGLGASVWTNDDAMRDRFVDELESGQVFVNAMVASDPRLPFGGIKKSGFGRELGEGGIREFVNVKTVWIDDQKKAEGKSDATE